MLLNGMLVCTELFCLYPSPVRRQLLEALDQQRMATIHSSSFLIILIPCHPQMSQDGSAQECVTFYVCVTLHLMRRGTLQYINHSQDFLKNVVNVLSMCM